MRKFFTTVFIVLIGFGVVTVTAQEQPVKTKYMVWEVEFAPSQLEGLKAAVTAQHEFFAKNNHPGPAYVQYTGEGYMYYSVPFTKYSEIDEMNAYMEKLWKDHPEDAKNISGKFTGNFKTVARLILEHQPDLSLSVSDQSSTDETTRFRMFQKFYVKDGKEEDLKNVLMAYKKLVQDKDLGYNYGVYFPEFAPDMSAVYFISDEGTNASDHFAKNSARWETMGEDGQKLLQQFRECLNKIEVQLGTVDLGISYIPEN